MPKRKIYVIEEKDDTPGTRFVFYMMFLMVLLPLVLGYFIFKGIGKLLGMTDDTIHGLMALFVVVFFVVVARNPEKVDELKTHIHELSHKLADKSSPAFENANPKTSESTEPGHTAAALQTGTVRAGLEAINALRKTGCRCGQDWKGPAKPLAWDDKLAATALGHAQDMAQNHFFGHGNPRGQGPSERLEERFPGSFPGTFNGVAENVAMGQKSLAKVMQDWKDSPGHCLNMLHPELTHVGVALALDESGTPYWVQVFGMKAIVAQHKTNIQHHKAVEYQIKMPGSIVGKDRTINHPTPQNIDNLIDVINEEISHLSSPPKQVVVKLKFGVSSDGSYQNHTLENASSLPTQVRRIINLKATETHFAPGNVNGKKQAMTLPIEIRLNY